MERYTMRQIRASLPPKKNKGDSLWVQYIARNVSYPFTYFFINIGLSAWMVSTLSVVVAFLACALFCVDSDIARWTGVGLLHFWMICDCVDGNIARVKKSTGPMGEFVDAQSGYVVSAFCYFGIGVSAYYTTRFTSNAVLFIVLGGLSSISNILSRLIHQKYTVASMKLMKQEELTHSDDGSKFSFQRVRRRIGKEIGLSGIFMILVIICQLFMVYDYVSLFYFLFCTCSLLLVIIRYSIKAKPSA